MKKLNKKSNEIFCKLISLMNGQQHLRLKNEGYLDLTIEIVGYGIKTPWGTGNLYSLSHYYVQEGDLMRDPEMCFIVVDNRTEELSDMDFVGIYPQFYQQDNLGIYRECIVIENNAVTKYKPREYNGQCLFANRWLTNILEQGFLTKKKG